MNVSLNSSLETIRADWQKNGGDTVKSVSEEDGLMILEEEDGDVFTKISGQWVQASASTLSSNATERKEQLEKEKAVNEEKIKKLDEQIQTISEEVKKDVEKAMEEIDRISEAQIENTNNLTKQLLKQLENGTISQAQFEARLQSGIVALGVDSKIAAQVAKLTNANNRVSLIELLANEIGTLVKKNKSIDSQIKVCDTQIAAEEAAKKAAEECPPPPKCDPIGFELGGVKYEFFIDKDKNGMLSNAKEFLGAENGWSEMQSLDADKDGAVDRNELSSLMVVVSKPGGEQIVMPATQLFKEGDSINLNSYKTAESQTLEGTGITNNILGTTAEGKNLNELVGTFGLTLNGSTVTTGYQTLDDMNWLNENYNFSDNFFKNDSTMINEDYKATIDELRTMVQNAMEQLGFSKDMVAEMTELSYEIAKLDAEKIKLEAESAAQEEIAAKLAEEEAAAEAAAAEEAETETEGTTDEPPVETEDSTNPFTRKLPEEELAA